MEKKRMSILRSKIYKILSTCFQYPEKKTYASFKEYLGVVLRDCLENLPHGNILEKDYINLLRSVRNHISILSLEDLQVEYTGLFITAFHSHFSPPYESIYVEDGRRLMGESTITVDKFYRRFGLSVSRGFKDLPDHISVELEFMHFLSLNESKAKRKDKLHLLLMNEIAFLRDHLSRWIPHFIDCLKKNSNSEFYLELSKFTNEFIIQDIKWLSNNKYSKNLDTNISSFKFDRSNLITLEEIKEEPEKEKWIYTTTAERYWSSPVKIKVVNNRAIKIVARDDVPYYNGKQDVKAFAALYKIYSPDRLKFPLKRVGERGEGRFKRITWDEALEEISNTLLKYKQEGHPEYVGFLRTHPPLEYMFNHFIHHYGSPNDLHTSLTSCYAERMITDVLTHGLDRGDPDYLNTRYTLLIGHNVLNTLRSIPTIARFCEAIRNGMEFVFVDPRLNEGSYIYGAEWIPIKPATDAAFLLGIMNVIIREKLYDEDFLVKYTNAPILIQPNGLPLNDKNGNYFVIDKSSVMITKLDDASKPALIGTYKVDMDNQELVCKTAFQLLTERTENYPPDKASKICTVAAEKIIEIARKLGKMKPRTCIVVGTVSAQYSNSIQYQRAKQILMCLVGIFDKPGGQYFRSYGDSGIKLNKPVNFRIPILVRDVAENRVDYDPMIHPSIFMPHHDYPRGIAQNLLKAILTGEPYPIKFLFIIGSDVISSHTPIWKEAFKKVDFIVKSHVWPDDDCDYADIILPEAAYLERDDGFAQVTIHDPADLNRVFTFLSVIQRVVEPLFGARVWHNYCKVLAEKIGFGEYYNFTLDEYWDFQLEPLGIDMNYLRNNGVYYPKPIITSKIEFGYKKKWSTNTGRINLYSPEMARLWHDRGKEPLYDPLPTYFPITVEPKTENEFFFIQGKCPFFKCNMYTINPMLHERYLEGEMGNTRLWINAQKAALLGIEDGDWVWIESESTGLKGKLKAKVTEGIHPSSVFAYYGYGRRSKLMDNLSRSKEGVNVQDFVPEHYVPWTASQAHCEAVVKVYKA